MKSGKINLLAMKGRGMFCNHLCAWQPVRVMHGDGQVRSFTRTVTVGELLKCHPHHFVCEPTSDGPIYHSGMLPFDMELEEGRVYLLLPLPRLLPHLGGTFSNPPSCPCFSYREATLSSSGSTHKYDDDGLDSQSFNGDPSRLKCWIAKNQGQFLMAADAMRKFRHRVAKSKLVKSLLRMSKRTLPQRLQFRFPFLKREDNSLVKPSSSSAIGKSVQYCSRNRWRPGLECISEVDFLTGLLRDSNINDR
ncbi:uncharacterized protein [Physcomitrium patens]|uniref:Uncharacterized protein n=1 Tax=Physcomitrium patens TaxID=3218 RepID=A9RBD8_PHYPA|nr:uncharacterized protein LOC112279612 [Physcomitrium patens]PNR56899.1 hypothetical protein PHYPA_003891 [Physcomitrium patens]|eukprot:XP_024369997.1 uncharacterized protein LOC112279612 [Physcomitrella patens]